MFTSSSHTNLKDVFAITVLREVSKVYTDMMMSGSAVEAKFITSLSEMCYAVAEQMMVARLKSSNPDGPNNTSSQNVVFPTQEEAIGALPFAPSPKIDTNSMGLGAKLMYDYLKEKITQQTCL